MLRKRKAPPAGGDDDGELSESIKRCRINTTPGQLRLHSDVHECVAAQPADVRIEGTGDPMQIILHFTDNGVGPNTFSYTVPRYYPHQRPFIRCVSPCRGGSSIYISSTGEVIHNDIQNGWTGVHSLSTAIQVLRRIRYCTANGTDPMDCGDEMR
jgi:ubiquitin-protein ligase